MNQLSARYTYDVLQKWLAPALVFILVLSVYLWSAPRTVVFEDDAFFIMASFFKGPAHPPGYPLFTLLGNLSTYFPIGSVAYRVHALSALLGALSCVCLWHITMMLLKDGTYAFVAAVGFGLSRVIWSQSIIAEVYSLNVLIFLLLVIMSLHLVRDENGNGVETKMKWMGFIYGLGLSNHWPLMIISSPMLLAIIWPRWRAWLRHVPRAVLFLLAGLLPYAWMVWRSLMDPEFSFYGPIESLSEFWYYVSRQGYVEADQNIGAGLQDKLLFCGFLLRETAAQYGYVQVVLVLVGIFAQFKYLGKNICIALSLGYLGSTFILNGMLGFNYDQLHQNIFRVYPVIAYAVGSIWLVIGLKYAVAWLLRILSGYSYTGFLKVALSSLILLSEYFINLPYNYRAGDRLAYEYAMVILETLPEKAIFITYSDLDTGPIGYLNKVERVRPDITLINSDGLIFSYRLYKPTEYLENKHAILSDYLESQTRPVYYTMGIPDIYGSNDYGIFLRLDKTFARHEAISVANPRLIQFYESLLQAGDPVDPWELMVRNLIISDYCRLATRFHMEESAQLDSARLEYICRGFHAYTRMVEVMLSSPGPDLPFLRQQLDKAALLKHEALTVEDLSRLELLQGRISMLEKDYQEAEAYFRKSIDLWPSKNNQSELYMEQLSQHAEDEKGNQ